MWMVLHPKIHSLSSYFSIQHINFPIVIFAGLLAFITRGKNFFFIFAGTHKPCLHESSNPGSTYFWLQAEFQSTNGCGLSQSGLQSGLGVFTLEANLG